MSKFMNLLGLATMGSLGAGLMYWSDPDSGRRRRARARDRFEHTIHASLHGLNIASRDLSHRVHGLVARARGVVAARPDDDVLAERVRSHVGRICSHPHAIGVHCQSGRVTLGGPIFEAEAARLVGEIGAVSGVVEVEDHLERHATADISSLQGGVVHPVWQRTVIPAYWSPAVRLVVGSAGAMLVTYGLVRRGPGGVAAALLGGAALARSVTNKELGVLIGIGRHPQEVQFVKAMTIHAPADEVFASFTAFETFPRFMRHVREVKKVDDNRYHWRLAGPAGVTFEWDGLVLQRVPGKFVSWTSAESAEVRHTGSATFEPVPRGTRLTIRMSYEPPLGLAGHGVAKLFGADPKRELDEDLLRFKSLLEQGKATGADGTVTLDELTLPPFRH